MEHAATGTCRAHYCFRCACYALVVRASCLDVRTTHVLVARALSCFLQTLSQQLTQFSPTQPLCPAPQSPLRAASQQLSPMLFPGGSPTLGSPVRGSLPVGQVQQVLFGPLPVQQQQQVQAAAQQVGSPVGCSVLGRGAEPPQFWVLLIWLEPGISHVTWVHYDATMCSILPVLHFLRFDLCVL